MEILLFFFVKIKRNYYISKKVEIDNGKAVFLLELVVIINE